MKGLTMALLVACAAAVGGCSKEDATGQNVAIDINNADPSDIEAVPADETADGTEEPADTNNADEPVNAY
jgi:hypothetical protein